MRVYREISQIFYRNTPISILKRIFVVFYTLPNFRVVSNWLDSANNPLLKQELSQRVRLKEFLFRPYLSKHWNTSQRLNAIATHYKLVENHAPILHLKHDEFLDLTEFDFDGKKLRVVIDRPEWMRREGEIGVSFFLDTDRIYTLMFTLGGDANNMKLIVGNMQGDARDKAELYKQLTKAFHGMRPRDFLIKILQILGGELGCKALYGISDEAHRGNIWLSKSYKHTNYDDIWQEHGGVKNDEGFFVLSTKVLRRPDAEIPANKRALYRRRYEFLSELESLLKNLVFHPAPVKEPIIIHNTKISLPVLDKRYLGIPFSFFLIDFIEIFL